MMLNPLNLKHLNRINHLPADIITLNLEDAIAPSRKQEALENIALFLSYCDHSDSRIVIRVNPIDKGGMQEILYLGDLGFDAIRVSKVKNRAEIKSVLEILPDDKELHISLETATAFRDIGRWGDIKRLTTANLGILDLLADLNLPHSLLQVGNPTVEYILTKFLVDSHIAGIHPVGFMYQDYNNVNEYVRWQTYLRRLGYNSAACMGPKQVEIANNIYDIEQSDLAKAHYIKEVFESHARNEDNGFMDERYGFIDEPIYRDACNILGINPTIAPNQKKEHNE